MQNLKDSLNDFLKSEHANPGEVEVSQRMLKYLARYGADAFDRQTRPAHFTASALVVSPDHSKVLLMLHKKLGKWIQPGGHADGDSDLRRVAAREVQEETGVEVNELRAEVFGVDWHPIPANAKDDAHEHADCAFLFEARDWALTQNQDEADNIGWFTPHEALELVQDDSVRKLIGRFVDGT